MLKLTALSLLLVAAPAAANRKVVTVRIEVVEVAPRKATSAEIREIVRKMDAQEAAYLKRVPKMNICWNRPGVADMLGCKDVAGITLPRDPKE